MKFEILNQAIALLRDARNQQCEVGSCVTIKLDVSLDELYSLSQSDLSEAEINLSVFTILESVIRELPEIQAELEKLNSL